MAIGCEGLVGGMLSGVYGIAIGEREGVEVLVAVEGVSMLGAFQPVDDQVSNRRGDDLVSDLETVAGEDDIDEGMCGDGSGEGKCDDEGRIDGLADDSGAYGASPEFVPVGEEFEAGHGVRVGELPRPEGDEASGEDTRDEAEDNGECSLIGPAGSGRKRYDNDSHHVEQGCAEEAQPDGTARGRKSVDLSEDVPKDIGDGKEKDRTAHRERADNADLLRDEIGDEQNYDEGCGEGVEIFVAPGDTRHGSDCDYLTFI